MPAERDSQSPFDYKELRERIENETMRGRFKALISQDSYHDVTTALKSAEDESRQLRSRIRELEAQLLRYRQGFPESFASKEEQLAFEEKHTLSGNPSSVSGEGIRVYYSPKDSSMKHMEKPGTRPMTLSPGSKINLPPFTPGLRSKIYNPDEGIVGGLYERSDGIVVPTLTIINGVFRETWILQTEAREDIETSVVTFEDTDEIDPHTSENCRQFVAIRVTNATPPALQLSMREPTPKNSWPVTTTLYG